MFGIVLLCIAEAIAGFLLFRHHVRKVHNIPSSLDETVFLVRVPKETTKSMHEELTLQQMQEGIALMEGFASNLGGLKAQRGLNAMIFGRTDHLSFEMVAHKGHIYFYVVTPRYLSRFLEQQLLAHYPDAEMTLVEDYNIFSPQSAIEGAYLRLRRENMFPINTYLKMQSDPLNALTNALSKLDKDSGAAIQFVVRSAKKEWHIRGRKVASAMLQGKNLKEAMGKGGKSGWGGIMKQPGSDFLHGGVKKHYPYEQKKEAEIYRLSPMEEEMVRGLEEKTSKAGLDVNIRVVVATPTPEQTKAYLQAITDAFAQYNIYEYGNAFERVVPVMARGRNKLIDDFIYRIYEDKYRIIFNAEELATVYHFPLPSTETPNIVWLGAKRAPAPSDLPTAGVLLGKNSYRGEDHDIYLLPEDRRRHAYVIGMTGVGKSVLLAEMARQDIAAGHGVCVVDPNGDLVEDVLATVPESRAEDVILFDPADVDRPIGLNMLEAETLDQQDFAVQEMIQIFYKLVSDPNMIGPMFEHNMRNAMLTLMSDKQDPGTITEIPRIFTDTEFQKYKLQHVTDPIVRSFWEKEMAKTSDFHKSEMLGYLISKVGRFIENSMMRNIIGQPVSGFNFRDIMDKRKILLVNLSKGKIGEVNSMLLGLIIVSKLQMAAFGRAALPENERNDFYLYIDEFQNYITDSIAVILSEARKYRLNLTLAHQYLGQLVQGNDTKIRDAVLGNVGTMITFRIGIEDAEMLAKQFAPVFHEYDLVNIDRFHAYVKLLVHNTVQRAFHLSTFPPVAGDKERAKRIRELSRMKYGKPRVDVEAEILRRSKLGGLGEKTPVVATERTP